MQRILAASAAAAVGASVLVPMAAQAAEPINSNTAVSQLTKALDTASLSAKKKKTKHVFVSTPDSIVDEGGKVVLHAAVSPKKAEKVVFERKAGSKWKKIGKKKTTKKGHAKLSWKPSDTGTKKVRAVAQKVKSKAVKIEVKPKPGPVPPPPPPPPPVPTVKSITATWPKGESLEIDADYTVTVQVDPKMVAAVGLQQQTGSGWQDIPLSSGNTKDDGTVDLLLNQSKPGQATYRAKVAGSSVVSAPRTLDFTDGGDSLYNVPRNLPSEPGVIVKAQEFPLTYPKLPLKNPFDATKDLIVPLIGDPAAGPPKCMTDPSVERADCKIPGKQYRFMYTDKRWVPNTDGTGKVEAGTVAATALVMVPDSVKPNAPVLAWAHPTLGQANQCSITRGVEPIPNGNITEPGKPGPGGVDINLTDVSFFLNQLLEKGYVVVMPDYLGIAVNGPTSVKKTYVLGPQEARDIFYAVKALHTPAKPAVNWPGIPNVGTDFVAAGHSQGGHASMWAGVEAKKLEPETGMKLKGVVAIAPATDINQVVNTQWASQVNWVLGPEVIETYLFNMPEFAMQNDILTPLAKDNLADLFGMCTTQALNATSKWYPNGIHGKGDPFMVDPKSSPEVANMYVKWGKVLGGMTPIAEQGKPNSFPLDMPLQLISGQGDDIVVSQIQAAMQQSFCEAGANMSAFWTPVATGAVNAPGAKEPGMLQAANHLNVLNFTWTNEVSGKKVTSAGSLLQFANARIAGEPLKKDCADTQTLRKTKSPNPVNNVNTWYVFPVIDYTNLSNPMDPSKASFYETGGSPALMAPSAGNPAPALGSVDVSTLSQEGCGFQFKKDKKVLGVWTYMQNPDCTQWGLWPWGEFVYSQAGVDKGWGSYPLEMAAVSAKATAGRSKVLVDVNPNRKKQNYRVKIQVKKGKKWKTVKKVRTKGTKDRVTVNVPRGVYRVELPAQHRHERYRSARVIVKK